MLHGIARTLVVPAGFDHDEGTGELKREHTQEDEKEKPSGSRDSTRCTGIPDMRWFEHSIELKLLPAPSKELLAHVAAERQAHFSPLLPTAFALWVPPVPGYSQSCFRLSQEFL